MTIKEAISHAKEVAERNRNQYKNCTADRRDIEHQTCEMCAEEHEQLAEWLEELQQYLSIGTVDECQKAKEVKQKIIEIVNQQLIAGKDNYKEVYSCFYDIVKVI